MAAQIHIHPAADLFPMIEGEAFDELVTSIKQHGLRERIKLDGDGKVLDGRNRLAALKAARIKFVPEQHAEIVDLIARGMTGSEYVTDANIHRRHLSQAQRRTLAGKLAITMEAEQAEKPKTEKVDTLERAARAAGVSRRTAASAKAEQNGKPKAAAKPKPKAESKPQRTAAEAPATPDERPDGPTLIASLRDVQALLQAVDTRLTKSERDRALAAAEDIVARLQGWAF